jgi:cytochrome c-type biogenesis protein CcmH/NrfF
VRTRVVITNQGSNISPPSSIDVGKVIGPWGMPIIALIIIFVIIGVFLSARKKPLKVPSAEPKEEKTNE